MASIPPQISNLDAAHSSTWRPFRLTSPIWTPHQLSHGVHSTSHLKSERDLITTLASIPLNIPALDAAHISTWRPFHLTSPIWTPPTSTHGVHSAPHLKSGRHTNSHMASIPPHISNLDATHISTWRPFCLTSQIWTPPTSAHGVHSSQHPQFGRRTDAAQTQPARWAYIFQKIPLSDIKMHNFIPLLKSDENYCTMALTTI